MQLRLVTFLGAIDAWVALGASEDATARAAARALDALVWRVVHAASRSKSLAAGAVVASGGDATHAWDRICSQRALRAHLDALPQTNESMATFVGDSLSEDVLAAIVRAAAVVCGGGAPDAAAAAAALLDRLRAARRFEMVWMFCGKAEQQAARAVLDAYAAAEPDASAPLVAACKKAYGLK